MCEIIRIYDVKVLSYLCLALVLLLCLTLSCAIEIMFIIFVTVQLVASYATYIKQKLYILVEMILDTYI